MRTLHAILTSHILLILLCLIPFEVLSQHYQVGDTVYVISLDPTGLYSDTSTGSEMVSELGLNQGLVVIPQRLRSSRVSITVQDGLVLNGFWLKVSIDTAIGYVFDGNVSMMDPASAGDWFKDNPLLGELITCQTSEGSEMMRGMNVPFEVQTCRYEHGTYQVRSMDGCFDREYEFAKASFNEVYHTMMRAHSYGLPQDLEQPEYLYQEESSTVFKGTALTSKIEIRTNMDGDIQLISHDCT